MDNFDEKFAELDQDKDQMLNIQQAQDILDQLNIAYYPGMLSLIISKIGDNLSEGTRIGKEDLRKFCQYSFKGLAFLHQCDLQLSAFYFQFKQKMKELQDQIQLAAAGPSPLESYAEQNINIKLQVGQENEYTSKINVEVIKIAEKKQTAPQVTIKLRPKPNKSKQLVSTIQDFIETIRQLINTEAQQFTSLFNSVKIQVIQESENSVLIKVKSQSQQLNQSLFAFIDFPDKLSENGGTSGHLKLDFETALDLKKMFSGDQNSIIDFLFSSYKLNLSYKGSAELSKLFYHIGLFGDFFSELKYFYKKAFTSLQSIMDDSLMLFCLSQDVDIDLKFDNVNNARQKLGQGNKQQLKALQNQIAREFAALIRQGKQHPVFAFIPETVEAFSQFCDSSIQVFALAGQAQININLRVKDIGSWYQKIKQQLNKQ